MMSMQEIAPARAQVRAAEVPNFDSIFRPKRQAYPTYCNCPPKLPSCVDGPPGPPGPPGYDGRMKKKFPSRIKTNAVIVFFSENGDQGPPGQTGLPGTGSVTNTSKQTLPHNNNNCEKTKRPFRLWWSLYHVPGWPARTQRT